MTDWVINPAGFADFTLEALAVASGSVANGDTLLFSAGDHVCSGTSHTKTGLRYRPLVDGQTWALKRTSGTGAVLTTYTGFDLDGGSGFVTVSGGTTYGIEGNGSNRTMTLNRVILEDNPVGLRRAATGSTFTQCKVRNNTGVGILISTGQAVTVNVCEFSDNGSDGLQAVSSGNVANRCDFYNNNQTGGTAQCNMGTAGVMTECIAEDGAAIGLRGATAVRCSSTNNGTDYTVSTNTDPITGPVGWVDADAGDFSITGASPAYHAGQPSAVTTDMTGASYDATAPSIGSREFSDPAAEGVAPTAPVVEAWLWSGSDATSTIEVSENGSTWFAFAITSSLPVREAMAAWQTALNASSDLAGTYVVVWDAPANIVTIDRVGGTFALRFPGGVGRYLGFSESSYAAAGSHSSDATPEGLAQVITVGCEVVSVAGESRLREFRHGRALSIALAYAYTTKVELVLTPEQARLFESGPLLHGRLRVTPLGATTPYSLETDAGGYLDLEVYSSELVAEGFLVLAKLDCQWAPE